MLTNEYALRRFGRKMRRAQSAAVRRVDGAFERPELAPRMDAVIDYRRCGGGCNGSGSAGRSHATDRRPSRQTTRDDVTRRTDPPARPPSDRRTVGRSEATPVRRTKSPREGVCHLGVALRNTVPPAPMTVTACVAASDPLRRVNPLGRSEQRHHHRPPVRVADAGDGYCSGRWSESPAAYAASRTRRRT